MTSPAALTAAKVAAGSFTPGGAISYTVVLANGGAAAQFNNPGAEFTDVLPAGLTLTGATATSGTAVATIGTNTVTWNGSLAAGASTTITIGATVGTSIAGGTVVSNQGTVSFDADGNGTNEAGGVTDDPAVAGAGNPTSFTVNAAPTISAIADATITAGSSLSVTFTVGDDGGANALTLTATSSNATLVPPAGLVFGGSGAGRSLTVTPAAAQGGVTTITVTVSDGTLTASEGFVLTVSGAPAITGLGSFTMQENSVATVSFTLADDFTPLAALTLAATSSNPGLVPAGAVVFGGADGARTMSVTPNPDVEGQTTITVTVGDGTLTTAVPIVVTVAPAPIPASAVVVDRGRQQRDGELHVDAAGHRRGSDLLPARGRHRARSDDAAGGRYADQRRRLDADAAVRHLLLPRPQRQQHRHQRGLERGRRAGRRRGGLPARIADRPDGGRVGHERHGELACARGGRRRVRMAAGAGDHPWRQRHRRVQCPAVGARRHRHARARRIRRARARGQRRRRRSGLERSALPRRRGAGHLRAARFRRRCCRRRWPARR